MPILDRLRMSSVVLCLILRVKMIRRSRNRGGMRCRVRSSIHPIHSSRVTYILLEFFIGVWMGESKWVLFSILVLRKIISVPVTSEILLGFRDYLKFGLLFWHKGSRETLFRSERRRSVRIFTRIGLFLILGWCLEYLVRKCQFWSLKNENFELTNKGFSSSTISY